MIGDDEDEFQPQDEPDDSEEFEQEVKSRRERLFAEEEPLDVGKPDFPSGGAEEEPRDAIDGEQEKQAAELHARIDSDMGRWADKVMSRRRESDERALPTKPPNIQSDFTVFPTVPFRPIQDDKPINDPDQKVTEPETAFDVITQNNMGSPQDLNAEFEVAEWTAV